jgi:AcrR family transcriptional regulator
MPRLSSDVMASRRAHVLRSALACFARQGFQRTTVDDVAREAGVSKGAVYTHVEGKDDLLVALVDEEVDELGLPEALADDGRTAAERLAAALERAFSASPPASLSLLSPVVMDVWGESRRSPQVREAAQRLYARLRVPLSAVLADGVASGEFRPVDPDVVANLLIALFDGVMVQRTIDPAGRDRTSTLAAVGALVLDGLRSDR